MSVVRVGQTEGDAPNGDLTFTVDPPAFAPLADANLNSTATTTTPDIVDPFMEMDPEQLERLETALQSEQAKQILGENVTAMLGMCIKDSGVQGLHYIAIINNVHPKHVLIQFLVFKLIKSLIFSVFIQMLTHLDEQLYKNIHKYNGEAHLK